MNDDKPDNSGSPSGPPGEDARRFGASGSGEDSPVDNGGRTGDDSPVRRHLAAAPEPGPADRRAPVARWVLTLSEPLMSTHRRDDVDAEMASFIGRNPQWAAYWFAGFLFDIASSLPDDDPWHRISAFADLAEISLGHSSPDAETRLSFTNDAGVDAPTETGATRGDGEPFGTVRDSSDLVMAELGEPGLDLGLVAVADPLSPLAAAVVGFSFANAEFLADALTKVFHHLWLAEFSGTNDDARTGGEAFLDEVGDALRWLVHRRRVYTGKDDPFPSVCGFAWMARADRLVAGNRRISAELGLAAEAKIDPGSWGDLRAW